MDGSKLDEINDAGVTGNNNNSNSRSSKRRSKHKSKKSRSKKSKHKKKSKDKDKEKEKEQGIRETESIETTDKTEKSWVGCWMKLILILIV